MSMDGTLLFHQELPIKNKRSYEFMQNIVSNNSNYKCECCPYGHHVNVDFVEFAKDISNSHNELQKIRRYQRKLERAQSNLLNKSDLYSTFPKDSIILSQNFTNQLSCSSSDSNSSDLTEPVLRPSSLTSLTNIINNKESKSLSNDVVYIPNNLNDSLSRSSDDSQIQSLNIDNEVLSFPDDTKKDDIKKTVTPKTNSKISSYKSKSFVVSYEHLMSIREQMSTSLKRVQDLEGEVKEMNNLRYKIDQISKENLQLKSELAQKKHLTEQLINSKAEATRKLTEISSSWCHLSDVPSPVIMNLERVLNTRLKTLASSGVISKFTKIPTSTPTQTDVSGSVIIDTLTYLTMHQANGALSPTNLSDSARVRKRNFGVTVRPVHHNFTQQVSPEHTTGPQLDQSGMALFLDWITGHTGTEFDRQLGIVVHQIGKHLIGRSYREALDLLANHLCQLVHLSRTTQMTSVTAENEKVSQTDYCSQTGCSAFDFHCVASQAVPESKQVGQSMATVITINTGSETERQAYKDVGTTGTLFISSDEITQTECQVTTTTTGVQTEWSVCGMRNDSEAMTDRYLIDDMIAEQIETAVAMIQHELIQEGNVNLTTSMSAPVISSEGSCDDRECPDWNMMIPSHVANEKRYWSPVVHNLVSSDDTPNTQHHRLGRCGITHSHFYDEQFSDTSQDLQQLHPAAPIIILDQELRADLSNLSDQSDCSGSSSILEATYYSADGRIEYQMKNQEEENKLVENVDDASCPAPLNSGSVNDLCTNDAIITSDSSPLDQSTPPSLPQRVQESCEVVGLWMNDSTTTCSKDLNESLAVIRQFWFEVTSESSSNLQFYLEKFNSINPTLQERIINMTDSNGNTCLHYAVIEGRWSIVRLLLQTHKVNVNRTNNAGYTVLMLVAVTETIDEESLRMLLDKCLVDQQSLNDSQQTALMIAASQGKTQLVQLLLEKGASVNIVDSDGSTALMCACDNGHLEVVRLLLSRPETDTELEDNTSCNAMKIAMDNSHKDIALLIFARNNLQKMSQRSKRRSGSSSHPTSPLNQRKCAK